MQKRLYQMQSQLSTDPTNSKYNLSRSKLELLWNNNEWTRSHAAFQLQVNSYIIELCFEPINTGHLYHYQIPEDMVISVLSLNGDNNGWHPMYKLSDVIEELIEDERYEFSEELILEQFNTIVSDDFRNWITRGRPDKVNRFRSDMGLGYEILLKDNNYTVINPGKGRNPIAVNRNGIGFPVKNMSSVMPHNAISKLIRR